jgi:hypothetical protein
MFKTLCLALATVAVAPALGQSTTGDPTGAWIGKWDNAWCVQFTIRGDPSTGVLAVTYAWREQASQPLKTLVRQADFAGNHLSFRDPYIEVFFSNSKDRAVAFGHFPKERSAVLVRDASATCDEAGQSR